MMEPIHKKNNIIFLVCVCVLLHACMQNQILEADI